MLTQKLLGTPSAPIKKIVFIVENIENFTINYDKDILTTEDVFQIIMNAAKYLTTQIKPKFEKKE